MAKRMVGYRVYGELAPRAYAIYEDVPESTSDDTVWDESVEACEQTAAFQNTDDADPTLVLAAVRHCASSWEGEARLLGNVRAKDIVRAIDATHPAKAMNRCPNCDDTGDVHRADGEWQPIENAPKDGTKVWVWNGEHYGVAEWHTTPPESETTRDYQWAFAENMRRPTPRTADGKIDWERSRAEYIEAPVIPNPNAGRTISFWSIEWATTDYLDYDGNTVDDPAPTHWMPLPEPPTALADQPKGEG